MAAVLSGHAWRGDVALATLRAAAVAKVNAEAEAVRLNYITGGVGQTMTYDAKLSEARLILIDEASKAAADAMDEATLKAHYPMIRSGLGVDGAKPSDVAALVQGKALAWAQIGATIERKRRQAHAGIGAATTPEQVAVAATVDWTA